MSERVRDYVILSGGTTREKIKAQIREQLNGEWVEHAVAGLDGMDKIAVAEYFIAHPFVRFVGWHPRMGEVGCWGTLLNAYQHVADTGVPMAFIEDDAVLDERFTELLDTYLDACPDDTDVFHLLTWFDRANQRSPQLDESEFRGQLVVKNWHDWPLGGIVVYPSGAQKILAYLDENPIDTVSDVWLLNASNAGWLNAMASAPYQHSPIAPRYAPTRSTIDRTQPVHPRILPR
jgi:GR25 family glycosyltransferase involved in LPS biosynthesis